MNGNTLIAMEKLVRIQISFMEMEDLNPPLPAETNLAPIQNHFLLQVWEYLPEYEYAFISDPSYYRRSKYRSICKFVGAWDDKCFEDGEVYSRSLRKRLTEYIKV